MELADKNVIYIGGFGGIGQQCLHEFLKKCIKNLIIFDLNENERLMQELQKEYKTCNITFIQLDITNKQNIDEAYKQAASKVEHFDIVINGCGLMNERHVDLTIQINLLGVIHSTLTAISYMDKYAGGHGGLIVNISSVAGLEPSGMFAIYSASKCGVTAFTRALANPIYFARTGISFITICPGFTDTALLESPFGKETFEYAAPMTERFMLVKRQTAAECGKSLVKTVEVAKNGSVWLLDMGGMEEIEMPTLWKPTLSK